MKLNKLAAFTALIVALLGFGTPAQALIIADVVWVIDTSGSIEGARARVTAAYEAALAAPRPDGRLQP